jgi:hypothetical protein
MILGQAEGVALAVGVRVADEDASLLRSALRHQGQRICNDDFGHDDWEFKKCSVGVGRGYTWTPRISRTTVKDDWYYQLPQSGNGRHLGCTDNARVVARRTEI